MKSEKIGLSIRTRIGLGSLLVVLLAWSLLASLSYSATGTLLDLASRYIFSAAAKEISLEVQSAYQPVQRTTILLSEGSLPNAYSIEDRQESLSLVVEMLRQHPQTLGIQAGYDNGDYFMVRQLVTEQMRERLGAPEGTSFTADHLLGSRAESPRRIFYDADLAELGEMVIPDDGYDPRIRPWYIEAINTNQAITTAPYVFFFVRDVGVTVGHRSPNSNSVVAADLTLDSIANYLSERLVTPGSEIVLRSGDGIVAWSGGNSLIVNGEEVRQRRLTDMDSPLFNSLSAGENPEGWLVHRENINVTQDSVLELIIAVPESELLIEFADIRSRILLLSFLLLILLVPMAWWLANRVSQPIRELHAAIDNSEAEPFELELPPARGNDEISALNHALQDYIADLKAATTARQKLENELDIARRIQMELVPGGGELTVSIGNDQLYAHLIPARAVGGDLYEMLALEDGRYFIAVGDVSDKGMPAALFMSRTVALMKMLAPRASSAAEILSELNNELVKGNDSCMFITLFCGFYQPETGDLEFSSAGHNPPVLVSTSGAKFLELESGPALGVFDDMSFQSQHLQIAHGESLCVYTDGITEAFNALREEFSDERLLETLATQGNDWSAAKSGEDLLQAVRKFAAEAAQSDDITLLILNRQS